MGSFIAIQPRLRPLPAPLLPPPPPRCSAAKNRLPSLRLATAALRRSSSACGPTNPRRKPPPSSALPEDALAEKRLRRSVTSFPRFSRSSSSSSSSCPCAPALCLRRRTARRRRRLPGPWLFSSLPWVSLSFGGGGRWLGGEWEWVGLWLDFECPPDEEGGSGGV